MKKQLTHISPHQSSKVIAALYFVVFVPFAVIGFLVMLVSGSFLSAVLMLFAPVLYGVVGYVAFVIIAWVYNLVAKRMGGIEVTVTEVP